MNNYSFESICRMSQKALKKEMSKALRTQYTEVYNEDGFILAKGEVPILLVAHMDTVHKELPRQIVLDHGKMSSPQGIGGDDRCGIYMILNIIKKHKCSVLFTKDEECGGIGASKFCKHELAKGLDFNYIIELDRKGEDDAVFYDCDNPEFEEFITKEKDWKAAYGSYSDICDVAPVLGCAAVNLSCGYYNAHTTSEYVVLEEMENNIDKVCKLIERTQEADKFEYIEAVCSSYYKYGGYGSYYNGYGGYYGSYGGWASLEEASSNENELLWVIEYIDEDCKTAYEEVYAVSEFEAAGKLLFAHHDLTYMDIVFIDCYGKDAYML